jgi:hypothetical protein
MQDRKIRFSQEDARVLKRVRDLEELGSNNAKLILAIPIFELITAMGNPIEFTASLFNSDWESMGSGAKGIQKIAACSAQAIVVEHIELGNPPPTDEAWKYFEYLNENLDKRCQA